MYRSNVEHIEGKQKKLAHFLRQNKALSRKFIGKNYKTDFNLNDSNLVYRVTILVATQS
jgi:hypothetical protein